MAEKKKLTKRFVDAAKPESTDVVHWDTDLRGFGLRIKPSGVKSYLVQYRSNGQSRRVTVGQHGRLTPDQARKNAAKALGAVANGGDPATEKRVRNAAPLVSEVKAAFLESVAERNKPNTLYEYKRMMKRDLVPALGGLKVADVKRSEIVKLYSSRKAKPVAANRVLALASVFFSWCEDHGYREIGSNPCRRIKKNRERPRKRYLDDDEVGRLGKCLRAAEAAGYPKASTNAIRLLLYTGFREMEALSLRWDAIDFDSGKVVLADTKTGESQRELVGPAFELLASITKSVDNSHVFPGRRPGSHVTTVNRTWRHVKKEAKLAGVHLHDLRHTYATAMREGGASLQIIAESLGHASTKMTALYSHAHPDTVRAAAEKASGRLAAALIVEPVQEQQPTLVLVRGA